MELTMYVVPGYYKNVTAHLISDPDDTFMDEVAVDYVLFNAKDQYTEAIDQMKCGDVKIPNNIEGIIFAEIGFIYIVSSVNALREYPRETLLVIDITTMDDETLILCARPRDIGYAIDTPIGLDKTAIYHLVSPAIPKSTSYSTANILINGEDIIRGIATNNTTTTDGNGGVCIGLFDDDDEANDTIDIVKPDVN